MGFLDILKICGSLLLIVFTVWFCFALIDSRKYAKIEKELQLQERQNKVAQDQIKIMKELNIAMDSSKPLFEYIREMRKLNCE